MRPVCFLLNLLALAIVGIGSDAVAQVGGIDRRHPPSRPPGHDRQRIERTESVCRSNGYRYKQCPVQPGYQVVDVRFIQALNRSDCRQPGYNFGFTENAVWVDHGCQGHFEVYLQPFSRRDPRRYEKVEDLFCKSSGYRYRSCTPSTIREITHVEFLDARNNSDCRLDNWGYDRFYVWVDRGCQAVLRVYGH